ncbi:hypothetical protein EDD68_10492 [Melghiribacillus thermohalophilus]|uniref:Uncharacterized protein n=1 Tax=Melghiribacillus thermohalophilus TaxID=1324956 RepID=A0A4R3N8D7_9BACI|nr:hypothetical protein [Melghiribacillus thermohalophilus]TCT25024.1 hypothetical protein EDD68_10492 [Melghiribacillus thermohalophilus]
MSKRKSIRGSQITPSPTPTGIPLDPNDLTPECIRVDKVYDWVFFTTEYQNKNMIPDEACRTAVTNALQQGEEVTVQCDPADPDDVLCNATILENGNPGRVQIIWTVPVEVSVLINGNVACTFTVRTQFRDEIALCVPSGITNDNINCRATQVICPSNNGVLMGSDPFGPMVPVRVILCKDVQVEYPVKLEVLAKFCFPRPNDIELPEQTFPCDLDLLEFPEQCPAIFPRQNTESQATALARNEDTVAEFNGTVVTGLSTLEAEIAQECSVANSTFYYEFDATDPDTTPTPTPTPSPFDYSFTFVPTTIERVTSNLAEESLTAFGEGRRSFDGTEETLFYELNIFNDPDQFRLILRNSSGQVVFDSGVVDALVNYSECRTFNDILTNNNDDD